MKISEAISNYSALLRETSQSPNLDIRLCLVKVLGISLEKLYIEGDSNLSEQSLKKLDAFIQRRLKGEPIAYILGYKEFWDFKVKVDSRVLVPRPETEIIIEFLLDMFPTESIKKVLEIGTGSGAISLALARERPSWEITATDISAPALDLARLNAKDLGLSSKIRFLLSDLFSELENNLRFDIIISNPPYIAEFDEHLKQLEFEPELALVSADNGYYHLGSIVNESEIFLQRGGMLILEHGSNQAEILQQKFIRANFINIRTMQDYSGNDRVTCALKQ